jgi:poly(ADP-ribose) glycohydrolase ARH3
MVQVAKSRYLGLVLGHALGDALGAPHEGGAMERVLWRWLGRTRDGRRRWTDDTQMALDLATTLLSCGGVDREHWRDHWQDQLAAQLARGYRWSRGYGPGAARTLRRIRRGESWRTASRAVYAGGSFGNGAATRAPVLGLWFAHDHAALADAAQASAEVTHAHPLGIAGAQVIALATAMAAVDATPAAMFEAMAKLALPEPFPSRIARARSWSGGPEVSPAQVRNQLGNGIAAADSCVTALFLALRCFDAPFEELVRRAIACGGDVDTIAAMAGAIWGARRGVGDLPAARLEEVEDADRLCDIAAALHARQATGR